MLLAQEGVQHLQTGSHALRQRASDHCLVAAHGFQDHAHIANGAPLDGQGGQAVVPPLLAHALHGGVGVTVVTLAGVTTATADRGEGHEVAEDRTRLPGYTVEGGEKPGVKADREGPPGGDGDHGEAYTSRFLVPSDLGLLT